MAKRIKIKGKTPRGLSKSDRILDYRGKIVKKIASRDPDHPGIPFPSRARLNDTAPSSTRKKLVKEGNPKFIGPRTRESIIRESFDEGSRQLPKVRMAEDESEPIGQNDEIYRRLGEMLLRKLGSRRV